MAGTDTLTTAHTGSFISGQPCHTRAHRGNVFDCLLDLRLINEVSTPAVRTNTEFDLRVLIDLIGLVTEDSWMPRLRPGRFGAGTRFCSGIRKGAACRYAARWAVSSASSSSTMRLVVASNC